MKIYGVRIYPQTVETLPGVGATIYVHGHLACDRSDLHYIFNPISHRWKNYFFAKDFTVTYESDGIVDPIPGLRKTLKLDFYKADLKSALVVILAAGFSNWASASHFQEGALLPLFNKDPSFKILKQLFWDRNFVLNSKTWPRNMRLLLHNWDDIYWQMFSTDREDVDLLISHHRPDPKLKMYYVELDAEYPDPSNKKLPPVS